jgi:hypothetical protein
MNKKKALLILVIVSAIGIPLTLLTNRTKQELRTNANASTTLSFSPESTQANPILKNKGETFPLDIIVNPGNHQVTFVKIQVKFDQTKLALVAANPFIPNTDAFPLTIEGPVITKETLAVSVSIGGDPTKAIQTTTKLGTLYLKALENTTIVPTQITFTTLSQALSSASTDQASENVLSSTTPAHIVIGGNITPTGGGNPSSGPSTNPTPILTSAPTPFPAGCTPESINFFANLNGSEVVPPNESIGTAITNISLTTDPGIANSTTTVSKIPLEQITSLYIGSPAERGKAATARVILFNDQNGGFSSPFTFNSFSLPDAVLNDMRNGKAYVSINTKQFPNGELRGQIECIARPTPVPTGQSTILSFDILLHGIGDAGDNPNPKASSLSNKNPLHPQRNLSISIIDSNNQEIKNLSDSIIYDSGNGSFRGLIDLGPQFPTGNYSIKIKSGRYLRKLIPGIIEITNLKENDVPQTALVAGDIKDDNLLNVLDYNIIRDCGYGAINPFPLADPSSLFNSNDCKSHNDYRTNTDLDDNGIINSSDYNLFLRELSVQTGD